MNDRSIYLGPRLKRLRRQFGLTQAQMADDLDISPSYVALIERNQRPVTADLLLRLARTYRIDIGDLVPERADDDIARLSAMLRDPLFADIDLPAIELSDIATSYPGVSEALIRLYQAWSERTLALADARDRSGDDANDPVAVAQNFLSARRNCFPALDEAAETLAAAVEQAGGIEAHLKARHGVRVRRLPPDVLGGSQRRYDRHREEILLDETLDGASRQFQLALQLSYMALRRPIDAALAEAGEVDDAARLFIRRALAAYAAAALRMPYTAFLRAAEATGYDIERLGRQFGTSFEQVAHRLTTLQKPGESAVPFFFIRVDIAGNVSKRLDGAGFPFARHGGGCPLWSLHAALLHPREVLTQWIELPDGKRFFSVARSVASGGGRHGLPRVERAIALGCAADQAHRLVYAYNEDSPPADRPTPIGVNCRLCQREACTARAAPPLGQALLPDDYHRGAAPYVFATG